MNVWGQLLMKFENDKNMYLLVAEEEGKVVSTVQLAIVESLTHNVKAIAVIENVVTHGDYRNRGYAAALLEKATELARGRNCYKLFWETGSNKKVHRIFTKRMDFQLPPTRLLFYCYKDINTNHHVDFYERYGWEFLCMVQGDDEPEMTRCD